MSDDFRSSEQKIRVGILYGGKSAEHEVSLQSARNVLQALDKTLFEPVLIGIDKSGAWHFDPQKGVSAEARVPLFDAEEDASTTVTLLPGNRISKLVSPHNSASEQTLDIIFPVLHGPMGEDGAIQGLLELATVPYVGAGILGSAVGMDKDIMKRLLRDAGLNITDFMVVTADDADIDTAKVINRLGLPLFVKPANMGSSVGVSKVETADGLKAAVTEALKFDTKALIEKAVVGDEIECAVLGTARNPEASVVGRIVPGGGDYYSYAAKYTDEAGTLIEIPARIAPELAERARQIAIQTFKVLACEGMARVDMFAQPDGTILVNEINTIPGFTKLSVYPKLWEASGLTQSDLISRLIHLGIERHKRRRHLQTTYTASS